MIRTEGPLKKTTHKLSSGTATARSKISHLSPVAVFASLGPRRPSARRPCRSFLAGIKVKRHRLASTLLQLQVKCLTAKTEQKETEGLLKQITLITQQKLSKHKAQRTSRWTGLLKKFHQHNLSWW